MNYTELYSLRYKLLDHLCDLIYILSTQNPGLFRRILIRMACKILVFRISSIDNQLKVK